MPTFKITCPERFRGYIQSRLDDLVDIADDILYEEVSSDTDPEHAADVEAPPACGDLVEINGFEYVVTTQRIDGSLDLELRDELQEDSFLGH